jgi:hypothetical protein
MEGQDRDSALVAMHRDLLRAHLESMKRQGEALREFLDQSLRVAAAIGPPGTDEHGPSGGGATVLEREFSWRSDPWVVDHTPLWTVPVLPMTYVLDAACRAAVGAVPGLGLPVVEQLEARAWCEVPEQGQRVRITVEPRRGGQVQVELGVLEEAAPGGVRTCAVARLRPGGSASALSSPPRPLEDPAPAPDPYARGTLFHGPSFQLMSALVEGTNGARARVAAASRGVPRGLLHPGMLDACLHAVPFMEIARWYPELGAGKLAFPYRVRDLVFARPPPRDGAVEVEVRRLRVEHGALPVLGFWLADRDGPLAHFELSLALVPWGPLASRGPEVARALLSCRDAVPEAVFTRGDASRRLLDPAALEALAWLPGSLGRVFGLPPGRDLAPEFVARAEHAAQLLHLHPSQVAFDAEGRCANVPWNPLEVEATPGPEGVETRATGPGPLDLAPVERGWGEVSRTPNLAWDLATTFLGRLVRRVVLQAPGEWEALRGRPVLYLANHQVGIESFLFCLVAVALGETPFYAVTRTENVGGPLELLVRLQQLVLGEDGPVRTRDFDSEEPGDLHRLLEDYRATVSETGASLYVAVEGQRELHAGHEVTQVSSVFLDLAIAEGIPVVPVRLVGGLPREPLADCIMLPHQLGGQDFYLGAAIWPEELARLPLGERRRLVLERLNGLGPGLSREQAIPPDPAFSARVGARIADGLDPLAAVLIEGLADRDRISEETAAFLGLMSGEGDPAEAMASPVVQALLGFLAAG